MVIVYFSSVIISINERNINILSRKKNNFYKDIQDGIFFWDSFIKWKRYGKLLSSEW